MKKTSPLERTQLIGKGLLTGWQEVFRFTLVQTLKSKAFLVSFMLLALFSMVSVPLMHRLTSGDDTKQARRTIEKVYVLNEGALPTEVVLEHLALFDKDIVFEESQTSVEEVTASLEEETGTLVFHLSEEEEAYTLEIIRANTSTKESEIRALRNYFLDHFENLKGQSLGLSEEESFLLRTPIGTKITFLDQANASVEEEDTSISSIEYWFIYGLLFIVLMVNILASTQVANAIVIEKSTRVVEYLLISIKPLALMVGKVLSMLTLVMGQVACMIGLAFIGKKVYQTFFLQSDASVVGQFLPENLWLTITPVSLFLSVVVILLGMLFFAVLAGLAGATVSRLEELSEGLMVFTMINLLGCYMGMGASGVLMGIGMNPFVLFAFLFPISSPFILPGAILIGKVSLPLILLAIFLLLVTNALLFLFVARVYESLILHHGNTVKLKQLLAFSKAIRRGNDEKSL
jgi:ABC-2 type transport system permease protein